MKSVIEAQQKAYSTYIEMQEALGWDSIHNDSNELLKPN